MHSLRNLTFSQDFRLCLILRSLVPSLWTRAPSPNTSAVFHSPLPCSSSSSTWTICVSLFSLKHSSSCRTHLRGFPLHVALFGRKRRAPVKTWVKGRIRPLQCGTRYPSFREPQTELGYQMLALSNGMSSPCWDTPDTCMKHTLSTSYDKRWWYLNCDNYWVYDTMEGEKKPSKHKDIDPCCCFPTVIFGTNLQLHSVLVKPW